MLFFIPFVEFFGLLEIWQLTEPTEFIFRLITLKYLLLDFCGKNRIDLSVLDHISQQFLSKMLLFSYKILKTFFTLLKIVNFFCLYISKVFKISQKFQRIWVLEWTKSKTENFRHCFFATNFKKTKKWNSFLTIKMFIKLCKIKISELN